MNTKLKQETREDARPTSAEQRLQELGIDLPGPPEPFGTYVEAVQTGNLFFLTGMLPTEGRGAKFVGRLGAELAWKRGAKPHVSRPSTPSLSRGSTWDRSTR
jgi:hypothetical protein